MYTCLYFIYHILMHVTQQWIKYKTCLAHQSILSGFKDKMDVKRVNKSYLAKPAIVWK